MATGLRIGEACGLTWNAVDLETGAIEVRTAMIRVRQQGLVVKSTKTDAGTRTLLPRWCVTMLRELAAQLEFPEGSRRIRPVSPAPLGGWPDPSGFGRRHRRPSEPRGARAGLVQGHRVALLRDPWRVHAEHPRGGPSHASTSPTGSGPPTSYTTSGDVTRPRRPCSNAPSARTLPVTAPLMRANEQGKTTPRNTASLHRLLHS
jgi:hypothetical protein